MSFLYKIERFMNTFFKSIISDRILVFSSLCSMFFLFLTIIIVFFSFYNLPPFIPLFNQMPWGVERLGTKEQIFVPIIICFVIGIINTILANYIYQKMPLVSRILCITTFLITILLFLFIFRTIQIII